MSRKVKVIVAVLAVVAAVLAMLALRIDTSRPRRSYAQATMSILRMLGNAAREFREATGREVGTSYYADLMSHPKSAAIVLRLPAGSVRGGVVLDSWGGVIVYNTGAAYQLPEGFFQSIGPDGIPNNTDDLRDMEAD